MQQLYQTQQSLWLCGSILCHERTFPGSNPTQSYCVHVEFKGNWYTVGPGVFWPKQVIIRKMTIFFVKVKENLHFLMRYFCELHDLENFEKSFFCISHPTHSLECLHLGEETRWSAFSWARKGCKTQRGSSLKNKPARKFSLENIYQREGNERVCCTGHINITILSSTIVK